MRRFQKTKAILLTLAFLAGAVPVPEATNVAPAEAASRASAARRPPPRASRPQARRTTASRPTTRRATPSRTQVQRTQTRRPPSRQTVNRRPPPRRTVVRSRPRHIVVVQPRRTWRRGGAVAAGAALGFIAGAAAVSWAGSPPSSGQCWYYTNPQRTQGFWDWCP